VKRGRGRKGGEYNKYISTGGGLGGRGAGGGVGEDGGKGGKGEGRDF
jgi:hypothetical protein